MLFKKLHFPAVDKILIKFGKIMRECKKLARDIDIEYKDKNPLIIGLLKGCVPFYSLTFTQLKITCESEFIIASSYEGKQVAKLPTPHIVTKNKVSAYGRHIIILEDIINTGSTLNFVKQQLLAEGAASVKIFTLLAKNSPRNQEVQVDRSLFTIPDVFVVGFGMDADEKMRNLPFIATLKQAR